MTEHFHIEPLEGTQFIKVYARSNESLPIEFNCNTRFVVCQNIAQNYLEQIRNFKVRKDDIWVITQPKSGTTWMLELVWLLQNNFDFDRALKIDQDYRIPFFELCAVLPTLQQNSIDLYAEMPSPRIIKSHLPIHLLPKDLWTVKPKIVFVTRNPKDAIVSFYHYHSSLGAFKGSKEDYINSMLENKIRYAPFGEQTFEFWQLRNESYVFFTSFERMKKDLRSVILTLSKFLGLPIENEKRIAELIDHLSFNKMKDNSKCNHLIEAKLFNEYYETQCLQNDSWFVRKGAIDSYKTELSDDVKERLEKWHEKQLSDHNVTEEEIFWT